MGHTLVTLAAPKQAFQVGNTLGHTLDLCPQPLVFNPQFVWYNFFFHATKLLIFSGIANFLCRYFERKKDFFHSRRPEGKEKRSVTFYDGMPAEKCLP